MAQHSVANSEEMIIATKMFDGIIQTLLFRKEFKMANWLMRLCMCCLRGLLGLIFSHMLFRITKKRRWICLASHFFHMITFIGFFQSFHESLIPKTGRDG